MASVNSLLAFCTVFVHQHSFEFLRTALFLLAATGLPSAGTGINPGAGRLIKEWPPKRFAALAADDSATTVLLGAEGDSAQADIVRPTWPLRSTRRP